VAVLIGGLRVQPEKCASRFASCWCGYPCESGGTFSTSIRVLARQDACRSLATIRGGGGSMRTFNVVVERDPDTGIVVGSVPGWPGAHSQGATPDELEKNLVEVIEMLLEDGDPKLESERVGLHTIRVA